MVRTCLVAGCSGTVSLHIIPHDLEMRRRWLRVLGIGEGSQLPPQASVCRYHFTRDSFANLMEFELGYVKCLRLKSNAVPTLALPRGERPPTLRPRPPEDTGRQSKPKATREIGCQTDPTISRHVGVQAEMKPSSQTKATRFQPPIRSVSCGESPRATSNPLKRKRCEGPDFDPSFDLNDTSSSMGSTSTDVPPHKDKKYIVHLQQLLELFQRCPVCSSCCTVDTMTYGTLLRVTQQCGRCDFFNQWSSQPFVNNIPAGNLQLCAAVLFTGSSFRQISKFLGALNVQGPSEQCFYKHQSKLLIPTVAWQWKAEQEQLVREAIDGRAVTLGGHMCSDSPGHSAKYGSYTMMNLQSNKVIDIQLVQSNEVGNSVRMEKEGLIRSLNQLEDKGLKVQALVTDRHSGVQKYLRENKKDIIHYFDPWHMGKGLGGKMEQLGKKKGTEEVLMWRRSVVNHLYWAASTSSSGEEAVAKWTTVANHIQNVHTHSNSSLTNHIQNDHTHSNSSLTNHIQNDHTHSNTSFPQCQPESLTGEDRSVWLKPSTAACERLTDILLARRFLKDIEKISPQFHTSTIEAFHSLITRFAPESVCYSFKAMLARLQIAALHYNENATTSHAATAIGALKTKPTSLYIDKLMALLFEVVVEDPGPYQEYADQLPVPEPSVPGLGKIQN